MKAIVSDACISCGMCAGVCPEVFQLGPDGLAHGSEFDGAMLDLAQESRDGCPVGAISIEA